MIQYQETLYRPPSEANSLILQATLGCSYNRCGFCGMYRNKRFRVRPLEELEKEIAWAEGSFGPRLGKVFLADGDALVAKPEFLEAILLRLQRAFPNLRRVSCYASPQSLQVRSVDEMARLRSKGLSLYYLGVESGYDPALAQLEKGVDADEMIRVAKKAGEAGVKLSTMILLGAAGPEQSRPHAEASATVINAIQPRFLSTLVMTPVPGTPLAALEAQGRWEALSPREQARELRDFLAGLHLNKTIFRSNHASNRLVLAGTLPRDQGRMLQQLDQVLTTWG